MNPRSERGSATVATVNLRSERGSATVTAAIALAALLAVAMLVVHVGAGVAARHRAQSAADLGALAAAAALDQGDEVACATALRVAGRMHARVRHCAVDAWDVVLTVAVRAELGPFGSRDTTAVARAGPVAEQ